MYKAIGHRWNEMKRAIFDSLDDIAMHVSMGAPKLLVQALKKKKLSFAFNLPSPPSKWKTVRMPAIKTKYGDIIFQSSKHSGRLIGIGVGVSKTMIQNIVHIDYWNYDRDFGKMGLNAHYHVWDDPGHYPIWTP